MFDFLNVFKKSKNINDKNIKNNINNKSIENNIHNCGKRIILNEIKKFNLDNVKGKFYVESIYDGDTITIIIPIESHIYNMSSFEQIDELSDNNKSNNIYFNKVKIRLYGIDTPELKPPKVMIGRDEHIKKAKQAKEFLSEYILGKVIDIEFLSNDKYGRPLAKIYKNNICLNELMIEKGYAKKYDGGTKDTDF